MRCHFLNVLGFLSYYLIIESCFYHEDVRDRFFLMLGTIYKDSFLVIGFWVLIMESELWKGEALSIGEWFLIFVEICLVLL